MALTIARLLVLLAPVAAFNSPTQTSFATFGNDQTRSLIRSWQPRALSVEGSGAVMTPASTENMKRFVRARIMLEQDPSLGCVACMENSLVVVLTRFSKAEHQLVLPLWQPSTESSHVFEELLEWHDERFGRKPDAPRLNGAMLESDRAAWEEAKNKS